MIICSQCSVLKNEDDFYFRGDGSTKRKKRCKSCDNTAKHQYYLKNRETIIPKTRKWYNANKSKRKETSNRYIKTPKGRIVKLIRAAKSRSKKYGYSFSLNSKILLSIWQQQNGKCALTNFEFQFENDTKFSANPFAPSIDRIDSTKGYDPDNVRFVCLAMNYALNEFGEEVFKTIAKAYLKS